MQVLRFFMNEPKYSLEKTEVRVESMNMNGIYASKAGNISGYQDNESTDTDITSYQEGQQIQGIISKVSDQISINFSGREVTVPKSSISNAKEGEVRVFQITDLSKSGMVLKEVGSTANQGDTENRAIIFTEWDTGSQAVLNKTEAEEAGEEETDTGENLSTRMTREDYEDLVSEGVSLKSYELERLARALSRIKTQREQKSAAVERQTEKLNRETNQLRESAKRAKAQNGVQQQIVDQLIAADLPVTTENIDRLEQAVTMADDVRQISDSAKYFLIKNELSPTISNVYKAAHASGNTSSVPAQEGFEEIEDAIDALIDSYPEDTRANAKEQARWLFTNGLYVTKENIDYKMSLDMIAEEFSIEDAVKESVLQIKNSEEAKEALMTGGRVSQYESLLAAIDAITKEQIAGAVKEAGGESDSLSITSIINAAPSRCMNTAAELSARRCLEEIRLKLTFDSLQTMQANGISVDTDSMSEVVEQLRAQEQKIYAMLAQDTGATSAKAASTIANTQAAVEVLQASSAYPLSITFEQRHQITLAALSDTAVTSDAAFKQAAESYETLMTAPRPDMGDSIQKAFQNVDMILSDLNLDTTDANQRAVRILGYNNIELTKENIDAMKSYDALVNDTLKNLTPPVTAELVKEGINPLSIPFDELSQLAESVSESLGDSKEQKYSEFLVELEAKNEITKEERESFIGIYRILHQVEVSDGAVVGAIAKSGRELTLNNLMKELRTQKGSHADYLVDDTNGTNASGIGYQNSITDQANTAFNENAGYQEHLIHRFMDNLSKGSLPETDSIPTNMLYDTSIEKINESSQISVDDTQENQRFEEMLSTLKNSADASKFLRNYGITDSIANIQALQQYAKEPAYVYETLQKVEKEKETAHRTNVAEISKKLIEACTSKETMQSVQKDVLADYEQTFKDAVWQTTRAGTAVDITQALQTISLWGQLSHKESYQIPVVNESGVSNINLTVIHNSDEKGVVTITYPWKTGESICLELKTNDSTVKGLITCKNASVIQTLQSQEATLEQILSDMDFDTVVLNFGTVERNAQQFIYANGAIYKQAQFGKDPIETAGNQVQSESQSVQTDILYEIAKKFIDHLSIMDQ